MPPTLDPKNGSSSLIHESYGAPQGMLWTHLFHGVKRKYTLVSWSWEKLSATTTDYTHHTHLFFLFYFFLSIHLTLPCPCQATPSHCLVAPICHLDAWLQHFLILRVCFDTPNVQKDAKPNFGYFNQSWPLFGWVPNLAWFPFGHPSSFWWQKLVKLARATNLMAEIWFG